MLLLCFTLGNGQYALPAQDVDAVLPLVHCRTVPDMPAWVRGYMVYRGAPVPVLDVHHLATQESAADCLGSRVLLLSLQYQEVAQRVGFLVEDLTETCDASELRFTDEVLHVPESPWSGALAYRDGALLQMLHADALLSKDICDVLFSHRMDGVPNA